MTTYDRKTMPRWEEYSDTYRTDWESKYGTAQSWSEHEPAYRYGWESAHNYRDRDWADVESDLERGWPEYHRKWHDGHGASGMSTWDRFKNAVSEGWHRARLEWDRH